MHHQHTAAEIARSYHEAWSTGRIQEAIDLLDQGLLVEVPIHDYPTRESFSNALRYFCDLVQRVDLLSFLASDDEAFVLYDMSVTGLGALRVAEHFTIRNGKIARLRQIHDTVAIRASGLAR